MLRLAGSVCGALLLLATTAVTFSGCAAPATQLVVVVDTDFAVPTELANVRARVFFMQGDVRTLTSEQFFTLSGRDRPTEGARVGVPFSFGVTPVDNDASRRVQVVLEALPRGCDEGVCPAGGSDCPCAHFQRRAITGFIEGKSLRLPMFLSRFCVDVVCEPGSTCTENGCQREEIPPEELEEIVRGRELEGGVAETRDGAGPIDADRMDAPPIDAPRADGGDAGSDGGDDGGIDAGCTSDAQCDDMVDCTRNQCVVGSCVFTVDDSRCTDCTGAFCDPVAGCQCPTCAPDTCFPTSECETAVCMGDTCVRAMDGCGVGERCCGSGATAVCAECCGDPDCPSDGNVCNGAEYCSPDGTCLRDSALVCNDGVACTRDSCLPASGCSFVADSTLCTAAIGGVCDAVMDCQYPSCTPATCMAAPCQTAMCMGSTCIRNSTCTAGQMCCAGGCVALGCEDGNPCTNGVCGAGGCMQMNVPGPCSDGNFCTVSDMCAGGSCSGSMRNCSDADPCDDETCNESFDRCDSTPNTASCNDGNMCTTMDRCSGGSCIGMAPTCPADSDPCTFDNCDPGTGTCSHPPRSGPMCNDGDPCTSGDICTTGICGGTTLPCDDFNECTSDSCFGGSCEHIGIAGGPCGAGGTCCGETCCVGACCGPICCPFGCCGPGICCLEDGGPADAGPPDGGASCFDSCASGPCAGAPCGNNSHCSGGFCQCDIGFFRCGGSDVDDCNCSTSDAGMGRMCDGGSGDCTNPMCEGMPCGMNATCIGGTCQCDAGWLRCMAPPPHCPCVGCGFMGICVPPAMG